MALRMHRRIALIALCAVPVLFSGMAYAENGKDREHNGQSADSVESPQNGNHDNPAVSKARAAEADRLLERGSAAYYQGKLNDALSAFEAARRINRTLLPERTLQLAYATGWIAEYYRASADYPAAIAGFAEAVKLLKQENDMATASSYIGNIGWCYMSQGEHKQALPFLEEALSLARQQQLGQSISIWASQLAEAQGILGETETAIAYNQEALKHAEANQMSYQVYIVSNNLANLFLDLDRTAAALEYYSDALDLARGFRRPDFESKQLSSIAAVLRRQGEKEEAFARMEQSIERAEAAKRLAAAGSIPGLSSDAADTAIAERCYLAGQIAREMNRYDRAISLFSRSLAIRERLGHIKEIGVANNEIGEAHIEWGYYQEAREHFAAALDHATEKENEATFRSNLGTAYHYLGDLERAFVLYQEAIAIDQSLGNIRDIAIERNNIGDLYRKWGRFNAAREEYQAALDAAEKHGWEQDVVTYASNLGELHFSWGDFETAETLISSARDLARKIGDDAAVAKNEGRLGMVYYEQSRLDEGIAAVERALSYARLVGQREDEAIALGNLGAIHEELTDFRRAEELYHAALAIAEERSLNHIAVSCYNNIGHVARERGKNEEALAWYEKAIEVADGFGFAEYSPELLTNRAVVLFEMGRYSEARTALEKVLEALQVLRENASGTIRREYLDKQIHMYEWLTAVHYAAGDLYRAADTIEASRAAYFLEQLRQGDALPGPAAFSTAGYTDSLPLDSVIISYAMTGWPEPMRFVFNAKQVQAAELNKRSFVSAIEAEYGRELQRFAGRRADEGLRFAPRAKMSEKVELLEGPTSFQSRRWAERFETIVLYYRSLLGSPILRGREAAAREQIARSLYTLLLDETDFPAGEGTTITIVPDGVLGLIPFETLMTPDGRYLIEAYTIRYVHSLAVDETLRRRSSDAGSAAPSTDGADAPSVLAVGGAIYDSATHGRGTPDPVGSLAPAPTTRGAFEELGYADWANLPGSLAEVEAIAEIVPQVRLLVGADATEDTIRNLSANGELGKFSTIHLAVHGVVVPEQPELSAIVLTLPDDAEAPSHRDGYLTAGEIALLDINARFVNLSACETALGKIYGGEGIVGLTQSFMTAGASGVGASLWKISDEATFVFMSSVYEAIERRGASPVEAIAETKRKFIAGGKYDSPYYWAAFIYYGEER